MAQTHESEPATVEIVITRSAFPAPIPITNGFQRASLPIGEPVEIDERLLGALRDAADIEFRFAGEAGGAPMTQLDIAETFDAAAILSGTVDDILPLLAERSGDELAALREAEKTHDHPRKTVLAAIDKAIAASN